MSEDEEYEYDYGSEQDMDDAMDDGAGDAEVEVENTYYEAGTVMDLTAPPLV